MGNSFCSCDIKSLDKNGVIFIKETKTDNKILNNEISIHDDELQVRALNKIFSEEKNCFLDHEVNFLEKNLKNFANIITEEKFNEIYFKILKNANINPLFEFNNNDNNYYAELNNEDYKTHNNSQSQYEDINNLQIIFNTSKKISIEFLYDEEKKFYKGNFNKEFQKHGYGVLINKDYSLYEGKWENDKACGFGRFIDGSGNYYEGNWLGGFAEGKGIFKTKDNYIYSGNWLNDLQEGYGEEFQSNGTVYKGNFCKGVKKGVGKITWSDKSYYEGEFSDNNITGKGAYFWNDGRIYNGEFLDNKMNGFGTFKWPDNQMYIGKYLEDKKSGYGKYFWNENFYYEGFWLNSKQHGKGKICDSNKIIEAIFRCGKIIKILKEEKLNTLKNQSNSIPDLDNLIQ